MEKVYTKILKNIIKCNHCGDVIESTSRYDFKMCSCKKVGIDGGLDYLKRIGKEEDYIELSVLRKLVKIYGYENYKQVKNKYSKKDSFKDGKCYCPECLSENVSIIKGDGENIIGNDIEALICDNCLSIYFFNEVKYRSNNHVE